MCLNVLHRRGKLITADFLHTKTLKYQHDATITVPMKLVSKNPAKPLSYRLLKKIT